MVTPPRHILDFDKQAIKNELDDMHRLVSHALDKALQSLRDCDADIAAQVVAEDRPINKLQIKIEELGVNTIALQQPVASDLRILMTDIYVSMELERIADHAVAIAGIVPQLGNITDEQYVKPVIDIADKCKSMLKIVMQAYDEVDEQLARSIADKDDEIDRAELEFNEFMFQEMTSQPDHARMCTYLIWITHNLERIGDRVTNIAERVVYMITNESPDLNR